MNATANISIRTAAFDDHPAIWQLAALDDSTIPNGPLLVAEVGGEIVAALSTAGGEPIADPFQRTAEAVDLLRMRSRQLARAESGRGPRRRLRLVAA